LAGGAQSSMFAQLKRESLRKLRMAEDKSPKGSIDAPIVDMIRAINAHPNYVRAAVSVRPPGRSP
jgi:tRNA wybutosine-synthesizing protein 3